jgi:hypothetical protein
MNIVVVKAISLVFFCFLGYILGTFHGFMFDSASGRKYENLLHGITVLFLCVLYSFFVLIVNLSFQTIISVCCLHGICHWFYLGNYYKRRNILNENVYTQEFFSTASSTSESWWDKHIFKYFPMDFLNRTVILIISLLIYLFLW